jgi:hypothetical protein
LDAAGCSQRGRRAGATRCRRVRSRQALKAAASHFKTALYVMLMVTIIMLTSIHIRGFVGNEVYYFAIRFPVMVNIVLAACLFCSGLRETET